MTNKTKEKRNSLPVEQHQTAAWQSTTKHKPVTGVLVTDEEAAIMAKEYVDTNQK